MPEGFRVEWGATDMATFDKKPWVVTQARSAGNAVAMVVSAIRIGISVLMWRMVDGLRGSDRHARRTRDAAGRVIRVSQPKPNWNVSVQINVGRSRRGEAAHQPHAFAA